MIAERVLSDRRLAKRLYLGFVSRLRWAQSGLVYTNSVRNKDQGRQGSQNWGRLSGHQLCSPSHSLQTALWGSEHLQVEGVRLHLLSPKSGFWSLALSLAESLFPISVCSRAPFTPTSVSMPHSGQNEGENKLVMWKGKRHT